VNVSLEQDVLVVQRSCPSFAQQKLSTEDVSSLQAHPEAVAVAMQVALLQLQPMTQSVVMSFAEIKLLTGELEPGTKARKFALKLSYLGP
jgi:hypothetical protein